MAEAKHGDHGEEAAASPRVVIVGGGFGGLEAAKALNKAKVRVTLIDRRNHHLFQPLLYQVATAALTPANIASPLRRVLRWETNAEVLLGEVESIDVGAKLVRMADESIRYDYLILATGSTHSYFGHDEWAEFAPGLKTIEDATEIRRRLLLAFEAAERELRSVARREWMTFVVVGGGPTGVELAGAVAEIARHDMVGEFRHFNPARSRVVLIEAGPRILAGFAEDLSAKAAKQLEAMGVEILVNRRVTGIDAEGVSYDGGRIATRTVLWAAGVAASPLGRALGTEVDRAGRVKVARDLTVPGAPGVFVVGDLIGMEQDGQPLPGLAPLAMQSGKHAARNILRAIKGKPLLPFHYRDKGMMATIGRAAGIAQVGKIHLSGFIAWVAWCLIHVLFLIGFRNRALVMLEWGWLYLFHDRGSRLITGPTEHFMERPELAPKERALAEAHAT